MLVATRDITGKLRRKFFPVKLELCGHKQTLLELCKSAKRPEPHFSSWLERGMYCARVEVGEKKATAEEAYQVLAEAEGSAAKLWIDMFGEVREVKTVPYSETFAIDVDDNVEEQVSKENLPNMETVPCKEGAPESNRRLKQEGFFSSLDNVTKCKIFEEEFDTDKADSTKKSEKKVKTDKKCIVEESPVKKPSLKFLDEVKISVQKSKPKKASSISKTKEEVLEPVAKSKESIWSVFGVEDNPYFLDIQARKKREIEKLAARTKVKTKCRKRKSLSRMAEFSQSLDVCSRESSSDETTKFKIPKLKKPRKKKEIDHSQKKINFFRKNVDISNEKESNDELEASCDYTPSIDELLKLPDRPEDGGKTMDEVLDDLDIEIAERKKKHEEEMATLDRDITAEKQRQEEWRERMKKNAVLRDRLEVEITESVLRRMFKENTEYLRDIEKGMIESSRHQAFHKSSRTRHALYYTMITDPFTDDQLQWTLEELGMVWMKTKREQMDNNEYIWKVLLAECFIKFYMDHFGLDKKETEKKISETPLRKAVEDSSCDDDML